jgi:hypothetical protein
MEDKVMLSKDDLGATARVLNGDCRPTVELTVPAGTPFKSLVVDSGWLLDIVRGLGPKGCEVCLSGRELLIRERFEHVVNVTLPGRG